MFQISKTKFGHFAAIEIKSITYGIELQIIHSFGAIVNKLIVNNSPFSFIAGYQDAQTLQQQHPYFSRSAKLFPFPNRLQHGTYTFQDKQYQLPANFPWSEHAVHGLLYNQAFKLVKSECNHESASVLLRFSTPNLHQGYPFAVQIDILYQIDLHGTLSCTTDIKNLGQHLIPFGDACHPYFALDCPLTETQLTMPECQLLELVDDLPSGNSSAFSDYVSGQVLTSEPLNHCFKFTDNKVVELCFERVDKKASLSYQQQACYPYLQLYTPDSEHSLAIEPMTCAANAFNNQIGLQTLAAQQQVSLQWQCQAHYQGDD